MNQFVALFHRPPLSWWDVLDIVIVSVLIYEALKLIRGTRAMQMAIGSLFVAMLFYGSRLFPLQTVNWLIRNLLAYVVIAAIVLFQSDIRRALSQLGRAPFFRLLTKGRAAEEAVEEIAVAAGMLAKDRVGAIIAIEREIGLRNYIESGIPIDATLSYDLLTTIFQPSTPLHDGAVIVREERIVAAGALLPLAETSIHTERFGTRHRAALGITEQTDAVVVVVSEENGQISLVERARIVRNLNEPQLARAVRSLLAPTDGRGPFGRRPVPGSGGRAPRLSDLGRLVPRRRSSEPAPAVTPVSRPDDDGPAAATANVQR